MLPHRLQRRVAVSQNGGDVTNRNFMRDEGGLELSEYAIAAALIMLAVVLAFSTVSANITTVINNLAGWIK